MVFQLRRIAPVCCRGGAPLAALTVFLTVGIGSAWAQEKTAAEPSARLHAVGVLAANAWQADPRCEEALIRALRGDASESVRMQAASAFTRAKYLTPKAHNALQHCVVGSSGDGFPGERVAVVKAAAQEALKKHPTSASPAIIAKLQESTARARGQISTQPAAAPTLGAPSAPAVSKPALTTEVRFRSTRDGSEESSPSGPTLGRPVPTDVPCPCNAPAVSSPAPTRSVPVAAPAATPVAAPVEPAPKASWLPFFKKRPATPAPGPVVITTFPDTPANPVTPTTATAADGRPQASRIPSTERTPPEPEKKSMLPSIDDVPEQNVSLKQRRSDLRESGLRDGSLRTFTDRTGAGPPPQTAAPSSGILRRWLTPAGE